MNWNKLLSLRRIGSLPIQTSSGRSEFQIDFDRIVFSSAFRRQQDKTQVVPLPESDYVRTRLTHSLEASCVGRSLGTDVGIKIFGRNQNAFDLGAIVAAACLAHDIGNPPFGHSGEDAIRHWFRHSTIGQQAINALGDRQKQDFLNFEGNAQGFRILTRLQYPHRRGGMRLTCATLAAFSKYPWQLPMPEGEKDKASRPGSKKIKFGFFQADKDYFSEVAGEVGLTKQRDNPFSWTRHPLALLVEAADDICYKIIDFEDGYRLGRVTYRQTSKPLIDIVKGNISRKLKAIPGNKQRIEFLRAKAINALITESVEYFISHKRSILAGKLSCSIMDAITSRHVLEQIKTISLKKIYASRNIVEIEAAGFEVLGGLLEEFVGAVSEVSAEKGKASARSKKFLQLLPSQFLADGREPHLNPYERLLQVTDFVSGMTDSYATSLYKMIRGISLPAR